MMVFCFILVLKRSKAPVNAVLAIIGEKDEDVKAILASESKKATDSEPVESPKQEVVKKLLSQSQLK